MRYIKTLLIMVAFLVGFPFGVYKLAVFLMTIDTTTLLIIFGIVVAGLLAFWAWVINKDDFEPPTFVWHDNNRLLDEINNKLDK